MSSGKRYTEEFKKEAVKQVSERGYSIADVAERLGTTTHSLYAWLKKYGEAVYATRAWQKYGEGPTKMGSGHGVFTAPAEGTARDVRFTRSKDSTVLYAILLGWESGQKNIILKTFSTDKINLKNLKTVELINNEAGKYLPLTFKQDSEGLTVNLPERSFEEMAYVLKLSFDGKIPPLDMYADLDCNPHYYLVPGENRGNLILGSDLTLTAKRKDLTNQWKLEHLGKGIYKILNRADNKNVFECNDSDQKLRIAKFKDKDNQLWKIDDAHGGLFKISNKQYSNMVLSITTPLSEGAKAELLSSSDGASFKWKLMEICEMKQKAFKTHTLPGTIEAEDYDIGCPEDAYFDRGMENSGGQYRYNEGVDIEKCSEGGYNVGWTFEGEWMAYTVTVSRSASYEVSFYIASTSDNSKLHLECDGEDKTGIITLPNTAGYQSWDVVKKTIKLDAGEHILKLVIDGAGLNLDKMVFEEVK